MSHTMYALVKKEGGPGLNLERVAVPETGPNDIKIKIRYTAICGTDLHIYNWDPWSQKTILPPLVTGHEYVGEICEIGQNVQGFALGDRVSGEGHIVCGTCRNCKAGKMHLCKETRGVGVNRNGAFAEYLVLPACNVVKCESELSEKLCAIFDPLGNAVHTALSFNVTGEDVLVTGAGPIGIMAACVCSHIGARNTVITDVSDYRLELARKLAPVHTVNVARESLSEKMKELNINEGFDVGLEMSGNPSAINSMIDSLYNGGKMAVLGLPGENATLDWGKVVLKCLVIKGIYGREMYETWYKMKAMLKSGLAIEPIITHEFDFWDFEKGFAVMNSGRCGKVVLDWRKAYQR